MALLIRRAVVIANPAARRGRRLANLSCRLLRERGIDVDLVYTERPGHAAELAAGHAPKYDAVFALGGDGTIMEVAGALAGTGYAIGVLAGGTGNLLARALGIPLRVRRAIPALLDGGELRIDLGRLSSGRCFAVAAGVGIDAQMVAETPPWLKRRLGVLAYALMGTRAALRAVLRQQYFDARLTVDGAMHERRAAAVMVANFGAVLGRRIVLGPEIRVDDGLLDGCIFSPETLWDAVRIFSRMIRGKFGDDRCLVYCRGHSFVVETTPTLSAQADGELLGPTPFRATVEPFAARLLVPRRR